jgi:uncharacterized protein YndB with AHSA1/START domain
MMTTMTETATQVYQVFIKASPEAIWKAITSPDLTEQYFHGVRMEFRDGRRWSTMADGRAWDEEIIEMDFPRRLVHGWSSGYSPEFADEPPSRVTWELEPQDDGTTLVTLVHDRLEEAPKTARAVGGTGWPWVLSSLKTFVETGRSM